MHKLYSTITDRNAGYVLLRHNENDDDHEDEDDDAL
jgi:hypothetical protein